MFVLGLSLATEHVAYFDAQNPQPHDFGVTYSDWYLNKSEILKLAKSTILAFILEFIGGCRLGIINAPEQNEYRGFLFQPSRAISN